MTITGTNQTARLCFLYSCKHAVIDILIRGKGDDGVTLIKRTDRRYSPHNSDTEGSPRLSERFGR
jgi:hypothetical protein